MLDIKFAQEQESASCPIKMSHKVLIVDDERYVHDITAMALSNMNFKDFNIKLLHAKNSEEAKKILQKNKDIALAIIDVVMETPTAGLDLVNVIRNENKNDFIRLVIRTGQADTIPKMEVIEKYDINDFKERAYD